MAPESGRVLPVYPATEGMSHKLIRALIDRHLDQLLPLVARRPSRAAPAGAGTPAAGGGAARGAPAGDDRRGGAWAAGGWRSTSCFDLQLMLVRARTLAKRQRSGIAFEVRRDLTTALKAALP